MEGDLNIFDTVVIGIMALSCLFAFFRGLVKEILSLVAWIGAGIVTIYYFPEASEKLQDHFKSPAMAMAAAAIGLYIVALMGFALVNMVIIKTIKQGGETGMLDNLLGLTFGAVRGAFIVSLGFFLISMLMSKDDYPEWITEAKTYPYAEQGAAALAGLAPERLKDISSLQEQAQERARDYRRNYYEEDPDGGYSRSNARQLDRLIDSQEPAR